MVFNRRIQKLNEARWQGYGAARNYRKCEKKEFPDPYWKPSKRGRCGAFESGGCPIWHEGGEEETPDHLLAV